MTSTIYGVASYRKAGRAHVRQRLDHYTESRVANFAARGMAQSQGGVMMFSVSGSGDFWTEPEVLLSFGDCPPRPI